ncbi:MAG: DEAD/DEAH box helicase [Myxococcaceae bacterium]
MPPENDPDTADGFAGLGLGPELLSAITALGYEEPTPVQRAAIPPLLQGKDVLGQAATGTGKTAAFALPILQRIRPREAGPFETSALIVAPTRELAMQVAEAVHKYGSKLGVSVLPVYGGQDIGQQLRRLKRGVDVVIATPGRALDHVRRGTLKLHKVQTVVLDEADEMLDLGFADDLEALLSELPEGRQTALFSATLPPRVAKIAEEHLSKPVRIRIEAEAKAKGELPRIRQVAYVVPRAQKSVALGRVLDVEAPSSAIIFCRTRLEVDELVDTLTGYGYTAAPLHGGMSQEQREQTLNRFKKHQLELLVATDVAARGLDVEKLSHVINFDLPSAPESYVHRIGRTGRAGRTGVAISLIEPREQRFLRNMERAAGQQIEIGQLPTLVDLRARRLELTRANVEEAAGREDLDRYRAVVDHLTETHELPVVAAAAIAALHEALNPNREDVEIELPAFRPAAAAGPRGAAGKGPARGKGAPAERGARAPKAGAGPRIGGRLFIGLGRDSGLRPADLVGAIANEAGLRSQEIGAIQIADHHAFVEVPDERADEVIDALRRATIRGRKVKVERDRGGGFVPDERERARERPPRRGER